MSRDEWRTLMHEIATEALAVPFLDDLDARTRAAVEEHMERVEECLRAVEPHPRLMREWKWGQD